VCEKFCRNQNKFRSKQSNESENELIQTTSMFRGLLRDRKGEKRKHGEEEEEDEDASESRKEKKSVAVKAFPIKLVLSNPALQLIVLKVHIRTKLENNTI
jgi:hypothetical protein